MKNNYKHTMTAPWYSSYESNNYGDLFYGLMRAYQPKKVVELGTKAGYSTYHIARALRDNGQGLIDCYDLWEKYKYNSVPKALAAKNLKKFKDIVSLRLQNVLTVAARYKSVDILHIDLGNHAELMEQVIPKWLPKVKQFIIMEGGSVEHDRVEWMKKYKKQPLNPWLQRLAKKYKKLEYFTIDAFPSITLIRKRS